MSPKRARWTGARKSKQKKAVRRPGNIQLGMLVIDLAAPALTAVDFAKQVDRDWFRSHPHRSHRTRRAVAGEIPGGGAETYVVVRQLAPGFRSRRAFEQVVPFPSDEAPEHIAHAIYDLVEEYRGRPVPGHEVFNRIRDYAIGANPEDPFGDKPLRWH